MPALLCFGHIVLIYRASIAYKDTILIKTLIEVCPPPSASKIKLEEDILVVIVQR